MVRVVRAGYRVRDAAGPVADSTPIVSVSVTVKVSPAVLPLSARLTAGDRRRLADPDRLLGVGAVIAGTPFTVTSIVCCVAMLPKLSVAFSVIVSGCRAVPCCPCRVRVPGRCSPRPASR